MKFGTVVRIVEDKSKHTVGVKHLVEYINNHPGASVKDMATYYARVQGGDYLKLTNRIAGALYQATIVLKKKKFKRRMLDGAWRYYPINYLFVGEDLTKQGYRYPKVVEAQRTRRIEEKKKAKKYPFQDPEFQKKALAKRWEKKAKQENVENNSVPEFINHDKFQDMTFANELDQKVMNYLRQYDSPHTHSLGETAKVLSEFTKYIRGEK